DERDVKHPKENCGEHSFNGHDFIDCISLHFISDITHYDEFDFAGCNAATGADCFTGSRGQSACLV
ncbi:MAG: hypothetical protein KH501_13485, partial [Eubacterium limosum]|nr:hypothetical protein [Eubacterium limosum]